MSSSPATSTCSHTRPISTSTSSIVTRTRASRSSRSQRRRRACATCARRISVAISVHRDERTGRVIVFGAIDNLWKGSSSQAVQNLNLMFGRDEQEGIA